MPRMRLAATAAATMLLAVPSIAAAQSGAGDNQYSDPFGGSGGGSSGQGTAPSHHATPTHRSTGSNSSGSGTSSGGSSGSGGGSGSGSSSGTVTAAPVTSATPPATTATGSSASATSASAGSAASSASASTLPRTGFDAGWEAAAGAVMLLAGLALRAQTRARRPYRRRG